MTGARITALCGGVGGAKLARGLDAASELTVVVNTGDDFEHLGLTICPDVDTVLYTLAGLNDRERGWGLAGETWSFLEALGKLGGDTWFQLGDRDLATHVLRKSMLADGATLTQAIRELAARLGIDATVLPMSDEPVRTIVQTDAGELPFQRYFVERRCEPVLRGLRFAGSDAARPAPGVLDAMSTDNADAIIVCPSNPYLSIDPLLALPDLRAALADRSLPAVAVSPVIGGAAVKGPAAKIMRELGLPVCNRTVAAHYRGLIDGLVIDGRDAAEAAAIEASGIAVHVTDTLMKNDADQERLATETVWFASTCTTDARRAANS